MGSGTGSAATDPTGTDTDAPAGDVTPTTAPTDVTWRLLGQSPTPFSTSAGPFKVDAHTASGYAHTPTGALIAATQIGAHLSAGRDKWEPTVLNQMVPSDDRERLLTMLRSSPQTPSEPGSLATLIGFRFLSYSPSQAVVGLVVRAPAGSHWMLMSTLLWQDGDWRMVAPPGGAWASIQQQMTSLAGVVEWGAR